MRESPSVFSVRRRVDGKILRFSFAIGAIGLVRAAALYAGAFYPSVRRWQRINERAIAGIKCSDSGCDATEFAANRDTDPDYVIDARDRYFIWVPSSSNEDVRHYTPLDLRSLKLIETEPILLGRK
jgi:hypothetical protein